MRRTGTGGMQGEASQERETIEYPGAPSELADLLIILLLIEIKTSLVAFQQIGRE